MNPVSSKLAKKTANWHIANRTSNGIKRLNNQGDTIIEVLIALTVVSSMLGGAYVLSSRTLNNNRQSQERTEAVKITETQVEHIKNAANTGDNDIFTVSNVFCMDPSGNVADANSPVSLVVPALNSGDDVFSSYTSACTIRNQSLPYYVSIERASNNTFTVRTRWERLAGAGHNEVRLVYRVYQ